MSYNLKPTQRVSTLFVDDIVIITPKLRVVLDQAPLIVVLCLCLPLTATLLPFSMLRPISYGIGIIFLLLLLVIVLKIRQTTWTITPTQLIYKRGIVSVRIDYMELFRVNDYVEKQTIIERFLKLKSIVVYSTDKSNSELKVYGIDSNIDVVSYLRKNVEQAKIQHNIYEIANY